MKDLKGALLGTGVSASHGMERTHIQGIEATLKLIPKPEKKQLIVAYFNKIADAMQAVNNIFKHHIFPASILIPQPSQ